jgi:hypothetical protein
MNVMSKRVLLVTMLAGTFALAACNGGQVPASAADAAASDTVEAGAARHEGLAAAVSAAAAAQSPQPPYPVPPVGGLDPKAWIIGPIIKGRSYSPGMPLHPTQESDGWSFVFGEPHYVTTRRGGPLTGQALRMRFTLSGGSLRATEGYVSARVRLYLERRGNDWRSEFYRWWSVPFVELVEGTHELVVPLTPDQWLSVYGKRGDDPAAAGQFAATLSDVAAYGMTFGGMFAGHGVLGDGTVRFVLHEYGVQ